MEGKVFMTITHSEKGKKNVTENVDESRIGENEKIISYLFFFGC